MKLNTNPASPSCLGNSTVYPVNLMDALAKPTAAIRNPAEVGLVPGRAMPFDNARRGTAHDCRRPLAVR